MPAQDSAGRSNMQAASPPGRLVDSHAHIFRRDLPMPPGVVFVPQDDFEIDAYEAILDRHGVTFAVIAAPRFLGTYNDYTMRQISGRSRFKATVILDPATDPYVLKAMDGDRAIGVRLSLRDAAHLPDLASYEYKLFFRRLADLGWHVHLHIDGQRLPLLLPALLAAPMRLVIDHFGRPDPALGASSEGFQALLRAVGAGRTWVKLSGAFRLGCDPAPLARSLLAAGGPQRLVWGSDCPFTDFSDTITYGAVVDAYESWVPNARDRAAIDETSQMLYGFDRPGTQAPQGG